MMTRVPIALLLCSAGFLSANAQCSVDLPNDTVTLYNGYDPLACATLAPVVVGAAPTQLVWSNGTTSSSLTLCDTLSAWYQVALTDDTLCTASDSVFVQVVDVRCGNNGNKVLVCHVPPGNPANAHTICISANGVPAHLAHGCHLGSCWPPAGQVGTEGLVMQVSPNPMTEQAWLTLSSGTDQRVRVRVLDALGREILVLMDAFITSDVPVTMLLQDGALLNGPDLVWVEVRGENERIARAVLLQR